MDAAIAETFTFLCSLKEPGDCGIRFVTGLQVSASQGRCFDFTALQPEQLAQILDANPKRYHVFGAGLWTAELSVILATRPYPLRLDINDPYAKWNHFGSGRSATLKLQDDGTAFVDALEKRQSTFVSLGIGCTLQGIPMSNNNFKRLLKLEIYNKLALEALDAECTLLPFTAKVSAFEYRLEVGRFSPSTSKRWTL
jgi:hypothetical protein